jgi:hypothetical protein
MEFCKSRQDGGGMQQCAQGFSGIMFENDDTSLVSEPYIMFVITYALILMA